MHVQGENKDVTLEQGPLESGQPGQEASHHEELGCRGEQAANGECRGPDFHTVLPPSLEGERITYFLFHSTDFSLASETQIPLRNMADFILN